MTVPVPVPVDLAALSRAATAVDRVKVDLPLDYVAETLWGTSFVAVRDRLHGPCPVHEADGDDHDPSLHVWREDTGTWRWRCSPCAEGGDVLSLLRWASSLSFPDAVAEAARLLDSMPADWVGTRVEARAAADPGELEASLAGYRDQLAESAFAEAHWDAWLAGRGLDALGASAARLYEDWGVGGSDWALCVPHRSPGGALTGLKLRSGDQKWAATGSRFTYLYGSWRDEGRPEVVLVEGESDAWTAALLWPERDVLALPHGVAKPKEAWLAPLRGRTVYVALDSDEASDPVADLWMAALATEAERAVRLRPAAGKDLGDHVAAGGKAAEVRRTLLPLAVRAVHQQVRDSGVTSA